VFKVLLFKGKPVLFLLLLSALSIIMLTGSSLFEPFPDVIPLPNGFRPEGIATGNGTTFFVGSIPSGAIYRGDLRNGEGELIVPAQAGHMSIGIKFDPRTNLLFVAGGPTGMAFVYDGGSGTNVASIPLTSSPTTFINDVVITRDAAYFTDSFQAMLFRVPLEKNGHLPNSPMSEALPLGGEFQLTGGFNANGIDATPNGETLVIVNSTLGTLYTVNPETGYANLIDLDGGSVENGDGILVHGNSLYVVQNMLNQIAIVELSADLSSGSIETLITSTSFDVPTTIARFGSSLYAVNARFSTPAMPDTEYDVVKVSK